MADPLAWLRTSLTAAMARVVAKPANVRCADERMSAIYAREAVAEDIEWRLTEALALFCDDVERRLVIDSMERIVRRTRAKEDAEILNARTKEQSK